jgi:tetratricopeptide (TPR) repeat protein
MANNSDWLNESADQAYEAAWRMREEGHPLSAVMVQMAGSFLALESSDAWRCADSFGHLAISAKLHAQKLTDPKQKVMAAAMSRGFAHTAVLIAEAAGLDEEQIAILVFKEADAAFEQGEYKEAVAIFQRTVDLAKVREGASYGNRVYHLGCAKFMAGEKAEGLKMLDEGFAMINDELDAGKGPNDRHQLLIWLTGAMKAKAQCLKINGENDVARKLLQEALSLAEENNLTVRKDQISQALQQL